MAFSPEPFAEASEVARAKHAHADLFRVHEYLLVGRGNRPARLHKRADTRLLGLINEVQPAEMPSRGAVACRRKDYIDAHLGG